MDAVTLKHVDKSYTSYSTEVVLTGQTRESRTRQVLKDLSLSFPVGQLTVIVGRSGCGKSTLLKLLAGKEQPDAGEIAMPEGWHSAMLSPDPYVITWTNVQRNVAMACGVGKTPEERYEKARDFVRLVGLEDYADLTPVELSTGMKQKASLVISLVHDPEFIIFDEPTNGLDVLTAKVVTDFLLHLRDTGHTIIVSTHIFSLVDKICDRVGIILDGHMVTCGEKSRICGGKNMEDAFFDIYYNYTGGEQQ